MSGRHIGDGMLDRLFPSHGNTGAGNVAAPARGGTVRPGETPDDYHRRMDREMSAGAREAFSPFGRAGISQAAAGAGPVIVVLGLAWLWTKSRRHR